MVKQLETVEEIHPSEKKKKSMSHIGKNRFYRQKYALVSRKKFSDFKACLVGGIAHKKYPIVYRDEKQGVIYKENKIQVKLNPTPEQAVRLEENAKAYMFWHNRHADVYNRKRTPEEKASQPSYMKQAADEYKELLVTQLLPGHVLNSPLSLSHAALWQVNLKFSEVAQDKTRIGIPYIKWDDNWHFCFGESRGTRTGEDAYKNVWINDKDMNIKVIGIDDRISFEMSEGERSQLRGRAKSIIVTRQKHIRLDADGNEVLDSKGKAIYDVVWFANIMTVCAYKLKKNQAIHPINLEDDKIKEPKEGERIEYTDEAIAEHDKEIAQMKKDGVVMGVLREFIETTVEEGKKVAKAVRNWDVIAEWIGNGDKVMGITGYETVECLYFHDIEDIIPCKPRVVFFDWKANNDPQRFNKEYAAAQEHYGPFQLTHMRL